jgi:hypothetical protein
MAWENIEERLKKAFSVTVSFPAGSVWLPDGRLNIDEWLTSIAETDEELRELDLPRIRFLQNRWTLEKLMDMEWSTDLFNKRAIWAMYVRRRAYILFSDGIEYQLVAAIEPRDNATLYRAVIGKVLRNPNFVPVPPTNVRNLRADLVPDIFESVEESAEKTPPRVPAASSRKTGFGGENFSGIGGPVDWMQAEKHPAHTFPQEGNLSKLLAGWIGASIDLPTLGYWQEDGPDSITTEKGKYVMKYKPSYGDKQREAQRRKKEEQSAKPQEKPVAKDTRTDKEKDKSKEIA